MLLSTLRLLVHEDDVFPTALRWGSWRIASSFFDASRVDHVRLWLTHGGSLLRQECAIVQTLSSDTRERLCANVAKMSSLECFLRALESCNIAVSSMEFGELLDIVAMTPDTRTVSLLLSSTDTQAQKALRYRAVVTAILKCWQDLLLAVSPLRLNTKEKKSILRSVLHDVGTSSQQARRVVLFACDWLGDDPMLKRLRILCHSGKLLSLFRDGFVDVEEQDPSSRMCVVRIEDHNKTLFLRKPCELAQHPLPPHALCDVLSRSSSTAVDEIASLAPLRVEHTMARSNRCRMSKIPDTSYTRCVVLWLQKGILQSLPPKYYEHLLQLSCCLRQRSTSSSSTAHNSVVQHFRDQELVELVSVALRTLEHDQIRDTLHHMLWLCERYGNEDAKAILSPLVV
jgi:hypothetical protein